VVLHTSVALLDPLNQLLLRVWLRTTSKEIGERKRRKSIPRERREDASTKKNVNFKK